ncbi:MFS transporter [Erwinia sp. BC051422]|uniref:MFS transporter n=1 Tax=Erwinia wuhanensis TaxID=3045167 RepID=UPI002650426B|nr:MFS transporter [Erwinia sp. BC051422]MDN8541817.1 MFS transporter [Erwinia sp. BC051422]
MVNRKYYLCALGYYLNIGILGVYIPWKLLELTGAATAIGAMLCIRALPGLLIGSLTGKLVDRLDKRRMVAFACLLSALFMGLFIIFQSALMNVAGLYAVIAVASLSNTIFLAAIRSYLHVVTQTQNLGMANSRFEMSIQLGNIIGTAAGGALTALASPGLTFGLAGVILTVVAMQAVRLPAALPASTDNDSASKHCAERSLFRQAGVLPALLVMLIPMTFLQMFNILLGPIGKESMQVTAEGFGYLNAAYSVGAMAMSLALSRRLHARSSFLLFISGLSVALFNMLLPLSDSLGEGIAATLLIGATIVWARVTANALLMRHVTSSQAGRLQAVILNMHYCTVFIAGLAFGYLADKFGYLPLYSGLCALVVLLMFIWLAVTALAKRKSPSTLLSLSDAGKK